MKKFLATVGTAIAYVSMIPSTYAATNWAPTQIGDASVGEIIQNVLNILLIIVVIAAVIYITLAGLKYVTSQGDAGKAKEAQAAITNAIIGLVVAFAAYFVVTFVLAQLGLNVEDFDVESVARALIA
ncbi:MAG: pilin [Candidatus Dojkabacteria bacterium]|nr:MAG: pilin [Candidatus Dojkabacteria bacterium]